MPQVKGLSEGALWPALRDYWHPVAFSEEIEEDKPLATTLLDERIVSAVWAVSPGPFTICASIAARPCPSGG